MRPIAIRPTLVPPTVFGMPPSPPIAPPTSSPVRPPIAASFVRPHAGRDRTGDVPIELWRARVMRCLPLTELLPLRATSRSLGAALVTAEVLLARVDGLLARHQLTGLIDVNRNTVRFFNLSRFEYFLRFAYVLDQGGSEWKRMGMLLRLAIIYSMTSHSTLPLIVSALWVAANLPTRASFDRFPLMMGIYRMVGHLLADPTDGRNMALQTAGPGYFIIPADSLLHHCRVVPLADLPANHCYIESYDRHDPVVDLPTSRWVATDDIWMTTDAYDPPMDGEKFPLARSSFTSFLLSNIFVPPLPTSSQQASREGKSTSLPACTHIKADVGENDSRFLSLLGDALPEEIGALSGITCSRGNDIISRRVILCGIRPGETVAARLLVWGGKIELQTTELPAADASQPMNVRFPVSMPLFRGLLRRFSLDEDVIDWGTDRDRS
ncbi:unnamed protein product [Vitrella brassicaformis CCMP3155]|uniref:Uncharacterized protein n=2 Tax=Vitrella brassicaformis TaxID=1169539 RepID=A0A0G4FTS1_VITBC|nr:unnamed protein product [Vitrella brassicaformis CCMP3155]|eukprot:CEM18341.1 unnamed protein product [Vitrella brassicaformis CCMP3155]